MMLAHGEEGQGLVEYSLIILLIALVVIIALTLFGQALANYYGSIVSAWPT
jgi:pilus assembly protein Flp/PilA